MYELTKERLKWPKSNEGDKKVKVKKKMQKEKK